MPATEVTERVLELERRRSAAHARFIQVVDEGRAELRLTISEIETEMRRLVPLSGELPVLVRWTQGPIVTIYHSERFPCRRVVGRGRSRSSFRATTEEQAREQGLARCTACSWSAHEREAS